MINTKRLKILRENSDLTQDELGKILNVSKYAISKWENGKEIIPLEKLNDYSNYFNINMDYILNISNDKKNIMCSNLDKNIIGENLKNIRIKNKLTQRDLASILNTTHSAIWAYEKGRVLILIAFAYQICINFNISMDALCDKKTL